jgi:hypothetical protein
LWNAILASSSLYRRCPRDAVLACIESYTSVVVPLDDATIAGLRRIAFPAAREREVPPA